MRGKPFVVAAVALVAVVAGSAVRAAEPPLTDLGKAGAKELRLTGDWLAAGAGAVWLSDPIGKQVYRLDARSGRVVKKIKVPQEPCQATAFGFGAFWTATCVTRGLVRIDPKTNRVSGFVPLKTGAAEGSIGAGEGAIWVIVDGPQCSSCRVARVDPKTLRVVANIPVEQSATSARVGYGAVWIVNPLRNIAQKIDPRAGRVVRTTKLGPAPRFFAVGEGGVWTLNQEDGSVTRLDPVTGAAKATIRADVRGDGGDMTSGGGWVWARGSGYLLTRIDPRTNAVAERYGPSSGSGAVVVGYEAVWISAHDVGTVWRLPLPKR